MGEIDELFVLALSLVWFAGATPDNSFCPKDRAVIEARRFPSLKVILRYPKLSDHLL